MVAALILYVYKCKGKPYSKSKPKPHVIKPKVELSVEPTVIKPKVEDTEEQWGHFVFIDD